MSNLWRLRRVDMPTFITQNWQAQDSPTSWFNRPEFSFWLDWMFPLLHAVFSSSSSSMPIFLDIRLLFLRLVSQDMIIHNVRLSMIAACMYVDLREIIFVYLDFSISCKI